MEPRKLQKKLEKIIKKLKTEPRWYCIAKDLERIRVQVEIEGNQDAARALDNFSPYYGG